MPQALPGQPPLCSGCHHTEQKALGKCSPGKHVKGHTQILAALLSDQPLQDDLPGPPPPPPWYTCQRPGEGCHIKAGGHFNLPLHLLPPIKGTDGWY